MADLASLKHIKANEKAQKKTIAKAMRKMSDIGWNPRSPF